MFVRVSLKEKTYRILVCCRPATKVADMSCTYVVLCRYHAAVNNNKYYMAVLYHNLGRIKPRNI